MNKRINFFEKRNYINSLLFFLIVILISKNFLAQNYVQYNISLLSVVSPETTNNWYASQTKYAGCYGWHNPIDNREYAIIGSTKGNHFIEVSQPQNPIVRDFVPGASQNSLWREIKTYQQYAYLVSDDNGSKFQIVDMSYLPDSVHIVYNSSALFTKAHTLFVDGNKLYCGGVSVIGASGAISMVVYDLSNPANPVLLRSLKQDYPSITYVHDMFVKNDTIYASAGNQGLYILKFNTTTNTFNLLADYTSYFEAGYNHSSYLTTDSKTLAFCDEVPAGLTVKLIDVSDLNNIQLKDTIRSHVGSTAHNPYITNSNHLIVSYYQDGVYIYDVSNSNNAQITGFFDTDYLHGLNDNYSFSTPYRGCWGVYPYLPSGILLASDMQNGLFVLDASEALKIKTNTTEKDVVLFPNPGNDHCIIALNGFKKGKYKFSVSDISGKIILNEEFDITSNLYKKEINTSNLSDGIYFVQIAGENLSIIKKWVKTN